MKTPLCFLVAFVAFVTLPVDFITTLSLLFVAGLGAILVSEYGGTRRLTRVPRATAVTTAPHERYQLAA